MEVWMMAVIGLTGFAGLTLLFSIADGLHELVGEVKHLRRALVNLQRKP